MVEHIPQFVLPYVNNMAFYENNGNNVIYEVGNQYSVASKIL